MTFCHLKLLSGSVLRGQRERWQVWLVLGICSSACLIAVVSLKFGLEKPVLMISESKRQTFVNNLASEVGKLENTEALSQKEEIIDSIKSKLRAAKHSYVPFSSLAEDSTVKALQSQLVSAKKQLADLMINLAHETQKSR